MARGNRLTQRGLAALAVCLGIALAGHLVALAWLSAQSVGGGALAPVTDPIFTRLLAPAAPSPAPPAGPPVASPARTVQAAAPADVALAVAIPVAAAASAPAPSAAIAAAAESPAAAAPDASTASATQAPPTASIPVPPEQDSWPADTRLTYRLEGQWRGGPLHGGARVQWQRQEQRYQAQVEIEITPFTRRTLTSQGEVAAGGLVPRVYEERSRTRHRTLRLGDADLTLADGRTVPRPEKVQDTASQFVELGHRFATGRQALALGTAIPLWLARPGGVDLWTYDVVAQDLLQIPRLGEVLAWRLRPRPLPQRRDNISAEIWFAPSLQYLPVRIRLTLGDEAEVDLKVETIEQR